MDLNIWKSNVSCVKYKTTGVHFNRPTGDFLKLSTDFSVMLDRTLLYNVRVLETPFRLVILFLFTILHFHNYKHLYQFCAFTLLQFLHANISFLNTSHIHTSKSARSLLRRAEQSRAVACCQQPASTVTLGIEPRWDPWPYICSVSRLQFFLLSLFLL
jgi:hypothetical protein